VDKATAKAVQQEMGDALKAIAAKHGLEITSSRSTYSESEFNLSIKSRSTSQEDNAATWARYAPMYGLPLDGLGQTITLNRKVYTITGLDLNRRAYPVRVTDAYGKALLLREEAVRRALAAAPRNA
jgi:hypothetical protein